MTGTSDFMSGFMTGQNSDRNYGWGMDGGWIWIILIFALFGWGGNGWGNRNNEQIDIDTRFIERDIFNTNQNVSNTACQTQRDVLSTGASTQRDILENRYTNQLGVQSIISSQKDCCCETNRNIDSVRYDNLLNVKDVQAQLASCCCDLKNAIHAEGEATRSQMQQDKIEQLREQVNTSNLALNNANLANQIINSVRPTPIPSYPVCSPYQSAYYGSCGFRNCSCSGCNI